MGRGTQNKMTGSAQVPPVVAQDTSFAARFLRQTWALLKKNVSLLRRNTLATSAQMFSGVVFITLLVIMAAAVESNRDVSFAQDLSPAAEAVPRLAPCQSTDCVSFAYVAGGAASSAGDVAADAVVSAVRANAGIAASGVKKFSSQDALDAWLLQNPNKTKAALHFNNAARWVSHPNEDFSYTIQVNSTRVCKQLGILFCTNAWTEYYLPLKVAVDEALVNVYGAGAGASKIQIDASYSNFPHPTNPSKFDIVAAQGGNFLFIPVVFSFIIQLSLIVRERESKLREAMRQMGLLQSAYWASWFLFCLACNLLMVLILCVWGLIIGLEFFRETSFALLFTYLFQTTMGFTALAFLLSTALYRAETARTFGFGFYILMSLAAQILLAFFFTDNRDAYAGYRTFFGLLTPMTYFKSIGTLINAASGETAQGTSLSDVDQQVLTRYDATSTGFWSLTTGMNELVLQFFLYLAIALYLDNVLPTINGRRKSVCYLCMPSYWCPSARKNRKSHEATSDADDNKKAKAVPLDSTDEDVRAEQALVRSRDYASAQRKAAVEIRGLSRHFQAHRRCGCCCRKGKAFKAVDAISYAIDEDQCFVLLGHNGAGKSTTINMMTGLLATSEGDALIFGHSINEHFGPINRVMGVCPQHDVLWDKLTAREHLELFAELKGIPKAQVLGEVDKRLRQVLLLEVADQVAGSYSGGMRRRLSIAVALLGDPKIVYLDEPTTGMDPVTRTEVWDMINEAKRGRVIFLTTHSMEEADILGDRIGIMHAGKIQALGSPLHLKNRWGLGLRLTMYCDQEGHDGVRAWMAKRMPGARNLATVESSMTWQLPRDVAAAAAAAEGASSASVSVEGKTREGKTASSPKFAPEAADREEANRLALIAFFTALEAAKAELGISDLSIGLTTLEEVFLRLSNIAEAQDDRGFIDVVVPEGAAPGMAIQLQGPGVKPFQFVLPAFCAPGDKLTAPIPAGHKEGFVESGEGAGAGAGDDTAKTAKTAGAARRDISIKTQLRALAYKNLTYQSRQKCQCITLTCFPAFILLILLIVNLLVFGGLQAEALCGTGNTRADCRAKGPNVTCLADLLSQTAVMEPALKVGIIDTRGRWGGLNMNGDRFGNFDDLEQPSWDILTGYSSDATTPDLGAGDRRLDAGNVNGTNAEVRNWHNDLTFLLLDTTCEDFTANYYEDDWYVEKPAEGETKNDAQKMCDAGTVDPPSPGCCKGASAGRADKKACGEGVQKMEDAKAYYDATRRSGGGPGGSMSMGGPMVASTYGAIARCMPRDSSSSSSSSTAGDGSNGTFTAAEMARVARVYEIESDCETTLLRRIFDHFSPARFASYGIDDFGAALATAAAAQPSKGSGIARNMSSQFIGDPLWEKSLNRKVASGALMAITGAAAAPSGPDAALLQAGDLAALTTAMTKYLTLLPADMPPLWGNVKGSDTTGVGLYDAYDTAYICDGLFPAGSTVGARVVALYMKNVVKCDHCASWSNATSVAGALCAYVTNLDAVRGLHTERVASGAFDAALLKKWNGKEVQTPFMRAHAFTSSESKYKNRMFLTPWTGLKASAFDLGAGRFTYTMYHNKTGVGSRGQDSDNLLLSASLFNSAVLQAYTQRRARVFARTFPTVFECNKDEWGDGLTDKIDCDLLIPDRLRRSLVDFIAAFFMPVFLLMPLWVIMNLIVYEKQQKLRMIMTMSGLSMKVYWAVNYAWYYLQYCGLIAALWILGRLGNVGTFSLHSQTILFGFFFLWGHCLISFAFVMSVFFSDRRVVTAGALLLILISWQAGSPILENFITTPSDGFSAYEVLMIWPPFVMMRFVLWITIGAAFGQAITDDNWLEFGNQDLRVCLVWCVVHTILNLFLVWYLENTVVTGYGVRKSPCFCCEKEYRKGSKASAADVIPAAGVTGAGVEAPLPTADLDAMPADVRAEHERVWASSGAGAGAGAATKDGTGKDAGTDKAEPAVRLMELKKTFGSGPTATHAVKGITLGIERNECFGLLGHNGAGKSTAIAMMCGLYEPTGGSATVDGLSIKYNIDEIHSLMGVCPQHDILWDELSAEEHLLFFGRLKGLTGTALTRAVDAVLEAVNLTKFRARHAGKFSGGMKRRLSVGNSLMGSPSVVYMDEPSTGLDPASRHGLWSVISKAKGSKSIVLTTHSMEEADVLCDRLSVMSQGKLQCIGVAADLKLRFGLGYTLHITTTDTSAAHAAKVLEFVRGVFPSVQRLSTFNGKSKFEIKREEVQLSAVFKVIGDQAEAFNIVDWGITETTLEEVFLKLSHDAFDSKAKVKPRQSSDVSEQAVAVKVDAQE